MYIEEIEAQWQLMSVYCTLKRFSIYENKINRLKMGMALNGIDLKTTSDGCIYVYLATVSNRKLVSNF